MPLTASKSGEDPKSKPVYLEKVNKQFIGIAGDYAAQKKNRLEAQQKHKKVSSHLKYALKLNSSLEKSLEKKQMQLQNARKVRQRHNQDIQRKYEEENKKRQQIEYLRQKSTVQRQTLKHNIKSRVDQMKESNKRCKQEISQRAKELSQELALKERQKYEDKHNMYRTIKLSEINGHERVNSFYRHKNLESLRAYRKNIHHEEVKTNKYEMSVDRMSMTLNNFNRKNQRRQRKLEELEQKLMEYTGFPSHESSRLHCGSRQRASHGKMMNDSRLSNRSRKPSEILLKDDLRESIEQMRQKLGQSVNLNKKSLINPEDLE